MDIYGKKQRKHVVFPYWYMVVVSLKPFQFSLEYPPELWPSNPSFANYVEAWQNNNFSGYFLRSLYVSVVSPALGTFFACAAAFVVSRFQFVGRKTIYYIFLGSMMTPGMTFILPQFKLMKELGLLNSLVGLTLIYTLVTALLFNFMGGWDEFTQALTFLQDPNKFTFPIALQMFQGQHSTQWGQFFAVAVIQTLPIVVIFIIFQRHIVKGMMAGAVKG